MKTEKGSALAGTIHRFSVSVNCQPLHARTDSGEYYDDHGFIMFPESYTDSGEPTRLIISCHGAGGSVDTDDSQVEHQLHAHYLLANGYAIMDVNGLPKAFSEKTGINIRNNIGSYIAVDSYVKAYHYCMEHFNLKKDVLVHGSSMGGISSSNLVLSGRIPVLAQSGFCPVLDTYHEIFLHPWSKGLPLKALGILYGLEKDADGNYIYDEEKICGYNPVKRAENYPVPVKFWHCLDDMVVSPDVTRAHVARIREAGGIAELHLIPTGGHHAAGSGEVVQNPSGNTYYNGKTVEIREPVEEALCWIRRFG